MKMDIYKVSFLKIEESICESVIGIGIERTFQNNGSPSSQAEFPRKEMLKWC